MCSTCKIHAGTKKWFEKEIADTEVRVRFGMPSMITDENGKLWFYVHVEIIDGIFVAYGHHINNISINMAAVLIDHVRLAVISDQTNLFGHIGNAHFSNFSLVIISGGVFVCFHAFPRMSG